MSVSPPLFSLSLCEAARGIRERAFTSEQLVTSCLERIRRLDSRVRAWAWLDSRRALAQARRADRRLVSGATVGPLHGVPLGIKDIIYTKGMPTGMGSSVFADFVPAYSAACVEKLEAAGAIIIGKTVTTEFASQQPGKTRHPWDARFTPGGSSSGSAAAVAAGFVAGALGSQTRGSTIRPAVYCGIVGYKPSYGLISRYGVHPLSATLDHVGVLTRTVDDAGLLAACLAGPDLRDPATVVAGQIPASLTHLPVLSRPPRLAAVRSPVWHLADVAQRRLFADNQRALRRAGAQIKEVDLPVIFERAIDITKAIHYSEIAHCYRPLMERFSGKISKRFKEYYTQGLRFPAYEYLDALRVREKMQQALATFIEDFDAIITPPATGEPPRTLRFTGDANFCTIWTLCGVPAAAFATGTGPNGMPMGLQVVGSYLDDRQLLRITKWCTQKLPFEQLTGDRR